MEKRRVSRVKPNNVNLLAKGVNTNKEEMNGEFGVEKVSQQLQNAIYSMLKSIKTTFHDPIPTTTPSQILNQTRIILQDYIYRKIQSKHLLSSRVKFKLSGEELSNTVVNTCETLEKIYPQVYTGVSRKLSMTFSSADIVKSSLFTVIGELFRKDINWGKLLSMLAITSAFALECVQQGHADFLTEIIDNVLTYTSLYLSDWLLLNGGWYGFIRHHERARQVSPQNLYMKFPPWLVLVFAILILLITILFKL